MDFKWRWMLLPQSIKSILFEGTEFLVKKVEIMMFNDKVVAITGGNSGIGKAIAQNFSQEGA